MMDLYDAVRANNLERVTLLVEQGADKDKGDRDGRTPLYFASWNGYFEVAQYLVEQGATVDKTTNVGLPLSLLLQHVVILRYVATC